MSESTTFQRFLMLLALFAGLVTVVSFVAKDRRSTPEKMVDKAKDISSSIPGIKK